MLQRTSFQDLVPESYSDAVKSPNSSNWIKAIDDEMDALKAKGTFTIVPSQQKCVLLTVDGSLLRKMMGGIKLYLWLRAWLKTPDD